MASGIYPLLFRLGESEAQDLITYKDNPNSYTIQERGFQFYCDKLTEMIEHFRSIRDSLGYDFSENANLLDPEDIFDIMRSTLVTDFNSTKELNLSLFLFFFHICSAYIAINNSGRRDPMRILKYTSIENATMMNWVEYANNNYQNMVPFFWKKCTFGYKVFLDLFLLHDIYPIGTGLNCYHAHGGNIFNGFTMLEHDLLHHIGIVIPNIKQLGKDTFINCYEAILEDNSIEKKGCIIILYYMLHEAQLKYANKSNTLAGFKDLIFKSIIDDFISTRKRLTESVDNFLRSIGLQDINTQDMNIDKVYLRQIAVNLYELYNNAYPKSDQEQKYLEEVEYYITSGLNPDPKGHFNEDLKARIINQLDRIRAEFKFKYIYDILWQRFAYVCSPFFVQ